MPTLFDSLDGALEGINVSVAVDGEAAKIVSLVETIAKLIDNPPDEFGDYLAAIAELDLPDFNVGGDLTANFGAIRDAIPSDLSDLTAPILEALTELEGSGQNSVTETLQPAIDAINNLIILFDGDLTCGILTADSTADAGGDSDDGSGDGSGSDGGSGGSGGSGDSAAGASTEVVAQADIDSAKAAIALLPEPLNVDSLLTWVNDWSGQFEIPYVSVRAVPYLDQIRDPLSSLVSWKDMDAAGMVGQFAATIDALTGVVETRGSGYFNALFGDINTQVAQLQLPQLQTISTDIATALGNIRNAVTSGDISAIDADLASINSALALYATIQNDFELNIRAPLDDAIGHLEKLPVEIDNRISQLIALLQPRTVFGNLESDSINAPALADDGLDALEAMLQQIHGALDRILNSIDISAVVDPLTEPLETAQSSVAAIDQQLVMLTLEVKQKFAQAQQVLAAIDTSNVVAEAEALINNFTNQLSAALTTAFEPVRQAIQAIVDGIGDAIDGLDPEQIKTEIQNAIQAITAVFEDPAIQDALNELRKLNDLAQRLDEIRFTPVTDKVVEGVDEIKDALASIDRSALTPPLPDMLDTALDVLPKSLEPVTDPLVDELGNLIEAGPITVLQEIKDIPAELFDQIRQYDPETLIGDTLSKPYNDMLAQVEGFIPSQLLQQLDREFETLKQRITDNVRPGLALVPLIELHEAIAADMAKLKPGDLIEPLDQRIQQVTGTMAGALPVGDLFDGLDRVIDRATSYVNLGGQVVEVLEALAAKLGGFGDAPAQLEAWLDGIFGKITAGTDITPLQAPLQALADAIENTQSAQLQAALNAQLNPLSVSLAGTDAAAQLTAIVQAHAGISRSAVDALPSSSQKTDLIALLDGFDPTATAFSAPLQQLARLKRAVVNVEANLSVTFNGWDAKYHTTGGVLAGFNRADATLADIVTMIREAVEPQFAAPILAVLSRIQPAMQIIGRFITALTTIVGELQAKVDELLAAPAALSDLGDTVQNLIDTIAGINLNFLQDSVNALYDDVREQFNNLSPRPLQQVLDDRFETLMNEVGFSAIIPPETLADLDADFIQLVDQLRQLNPDTVLVEPLQTEFEETILPLVEAFDLTPFIEALIARLEPLEDELRVELERVDTAYQQMLAAAP